MCVSINPMIAHSVFMTIGCCVSCNNGASFEQTSESCDYCENCREMFSKLHMVHHFVHYGTDH